MDQEAESEVLPLRITERRRRKAAPTDAGGRYTTSSLKGGRGARGIQSGDDVTSDSFAAADGVDAFIGLRLEVNLLDRDAQGFGEGLAHFGEMRAELGTLEYHHDIDVFNFEGALAEKFTNVLEKVEAVGALPLGIGVRKMRANIAKARGAEERVTKSMGNDVAIRVADGTFVKWNFDTTDDELAAFGKAVKVIANAAAKAHGFLCSHWR